MVKIFVFDTETTGLLPTSKLCYKEKKEIEHGLRFFENMDIANEYWNTWIDKFPYITQLSYVVYDTENSHKTKLFNRYIQLPDKAIISTEASVITSIYKTRQEAIRSCKNIRNVHILEEDKKLIHIVDALNEFMKDYCNCTHIVAHNIYFDIFMILAELKRQSRYNDMESIILEKPKFVCTMMRTIKLCNITNISTTGKIFIKFPKLVEAYETLFNVKIKKDELHNAFIDVVMCLRIFCRLEPLNMDIYGKNKEITTLLSVLSQHNYYTRSKCV